MHICRILIRNFRNFALLDVTTRPGVTCVVGENNTGKTNLLYAIRLPIDAALSSQYRSLTIDDFPSGTDVSKPQQVLVCLEIKDFADKPNEEAMVAPWAIDDNLARITYRFKPKPKVRDEILAEDRPASGLTLDDYHWQIRGAGGECDPLSVEWHEDFGTSVRFDELQQFLVVVMHPLRDVEQSLRQSRSSPLAKLLAASNIPETEQDALVKVLSDANDGIARSTTIAKVGKDIHDTFAEASGKTFKMDVELGMSPPSFNDISRSLTVLLSNKAMKRFDPRLNGLGMNNVLYISMLLKSFENRIAAGKTPGQLLLVEEPEAHLHPQLQRVLFASLEQRAFQTIATTHSTHITSQVPLESIVVLTDDGTPVTTSSSPAHDADLTDGEVKDLERYLDATRATLLYARKVILVEGPAELFLIPAIVRQVMGVDLEELGISMIPIYGVHFGAYTKLFSTMAMHKRCAVIADGDLSPSDATDPSEDDPSELPDFPKPTLNDLENDYVKVFACTSTFERAMTSVHTLEMFIETARELGAPNVTARLTEYHRALSEEMDQEILNDARNLVLATAKRFGKARFAQVAAKHAGLARRMPKYISKAIKWLVNDEAE